MKERQLNHGKLDGEQRWRARFEELTLQTKSNGGHETSVRRRHRLFAAGALKLDLLAFTHIYRLTNFLLYIYFFEQPEMTHYEVRI